MYILNGTKNEILNSEFVERFCVVSKCDASLIVASYGADRCVTLARYGNDQEAMQALSGLFGALAAGQAYFDMPESLMYAEQTIKKDARTRRKGGS